MEDLVAGALKAMLLVFIICSADAIVPAKLLHLTLSVKAIKGTLGCADLSLWRFKQLPTNIELFHGNQNTHHPKAHRIVHSLVETSLQRQLFLLWACSHKGRSQGSQGSVRHQD